MKYELFTTGEVRNFEELRSYVGRSEAVSVTDVTSGGLFLNDVTDLSSSDDNQDTVVDYKQRRWKRVGAGNLSFLQSGTGAVSRTAQAKLREAITPEDFGAIGDGTLHTVQEWIDSGRFSSLAAVQVTYPWVTATTDSLDWAALLAWQSVLGDGVNGAARGNYIINRRLQWVDKSSFHVLLDGTFTMAAGVGTDSNFSMLLMRNCTDFVVEGGAVFDGNRDNRTPTEGSGHLIRIEGGARGIFSGITAKNGTTDNWYVTPDPNHQADLEYYPADMVFINCHGSNAYRHNMTVVGAIKPRIVFGTYRDATGFTGGGGVPACSGIAIEPGDDEDHGVQGAIVYGADCSGNSKYGCYLGGKVISNVTGARIWVTGEDNGYGLFETGRVDDVQAWLDVGPHSGTLGTSAAPVFVGSVSSNVTLHSVTAKDITATGALAVVRITNGATEVRVGSVIVQGSSLPAIDCSADDSEIGSVSARDVSTYGAYIRGARNRVGMLDLRTISGIGVRVAAENVKIDGYWLQDCSSTTASLFAESTATGLDLGAGRIHQTTSVPVGATALRFDAAPAAVGRVVATGGYTSADMITASAGLLADSAIFGMTPNPFRKLVSWQPGGGAGLAAAGTATTTTNMTHASLGDTVEVTKAVNAPVGLAVDGFVSANGTITLHAVAAAACPTINAGNYAVRVVKS